MAEQRKRRTSINDVAARAGVSTATVSKVLHGVVTVKPANAERVRRAVRDLNYRMDPLASGLRRATRQIIGLVVPELESEFFGRMASRLEILVENAGYSLAIASSHESEQREQRMIERMHDWRVAGTILAPVRSERGEGASLMKSLGMTGVLIDRVMANGAFDTVTADNARASARVAARLIEAGHRHVLLLGLSDVSKNVRTRISGFKSEVARSCPALRVDVLSAQGPMTDLRGLLCDYLGQNQPTAVFSLFQKGTLAALFEFRRRGIRCPEDISLISFDDAAWLEATYPSVTAVAQPIISMTESAFERLITRIKGDTGPSLARLEPCDFLERDSLAAIGTTPLRQIRNQKCGTSSVR